MTEHIEGTAYMPFPPFHEWMSPTVDFVGVDALKSAISDFGSLPPSTRARAVQAVIVRSEALLQRALALSNVFMKTRGGYLQVDIDQAAHELLNAAKVELDKLVETHRTTFAALNLSVGDVQATGDAQSPGHRLALRYGPRLLRVSANSHAPGDAALHVEIGVEVPKDAAPNDVFILSAGKGFPQIQLLVSELLPQRQILADVQFSLFLQDVVVELVKALQRLSEESIQRKGYTLQR